jgi:septum formation protein
MAVILASASAIRRTLLEQAGVVLSCRPAAVDEAEVRRRHQGHPGRSAAGVALVLAEMKARRVAVDHPGAAVIGADQMLECGDRWFDKPGSVAEAREQLRTLRGRSHVLSSAVVVVRDGTVLWHRTEQARLTMRSFSEGFLEDYLAAAGAEICRSVGGYHIEGRGLQLF